VVIVVATACGSATPDSAEPKPTEDASEISKDPEPQGPGIKLVVHPDGAEVIIDGELLGSITADALTLSPGLHQITISKDGYKTWRAEVAIKDEIETLRVTLEPTR